MTYWITHEVQTPDGTRLRCYNRHDYQVYSDKNGESYMIDGLGYYTRSSVNNQPALDLSITSDSPFLIKREANFWGTYGIKQDFAEPEYISPSQMTSDHIQAVIKTQPLATEIKELFEQEQQYRSELSLMGDWVEPTGLDESKIPKWFKPT